MKSTLSPCILLISMTTLLTQCGPSEAKDVTDGVSVYVFGEDFIESGIPAEEMADGWSVNFETFQVEVDQVTVADRTFDMPTSIELAKKSDGAGHLLTSLDVPEGTHDASSYTLSNIRVRGTATRDNVTKNFDWTIDTTTRYTACETSTAVTSSSPGTFQITVHADHFFYDSLVADDPEVVFQALADADADNDGTITREELEQAGLGAYDPGSANEVDNLWTWLEAQSATLGHVDGEGHCDFELVQ